MKKHTQSPYESSKVSYKPSGIEWLGEIPQSWENVSIRSCFTESNQRCNTDSYPLLSVTIANGIIYQDNIENKKDISNDDKSNYKIVPLNAVAYNKMRMWQGAVGVNTLTTGIVSPAYIVAIPNEKILPNFVSYLFKSKIMIGEFDKNSYGLCLDMNNLRYDDFRNIKIPLPPLQEQKEIAEFLDSKCEKIQNYIDKKQKLITLLQEKKQALINQAVTKGLNPNIEFKNSDIEYLGLIPHHWEVVKVKYIATTNIGLVYDPSEIATNENVGYPVLRANNIQNGKIDYKDVIYVAKKIDDKQLAISGDLLMCVRNGSENLLGKTAKIENNNFSFGAFTAIIRSDLNNYLYWIFQTEMLKKSISSFIVSIGIGQISQDDIKNFKIPLPPLQEQKEIAEFLDSKVAQIDSVIEKTKKQIELVKEYKNTLINEAVCGRIDL
ncbi:restriction endonuclease subunit S [Campylobacter upsaliensis]|uniref:restriction endonuclease subunit S n=1 Tax=Campylobacter upsaliensis TaxID=28080 RepID=UPI002226A334|nr:restriction endonuclease subunit S [Campylobacter upsaliensis]